MSGPGGETSLVTSIAGNHNEYRSLAELDQLTLEVLLRAAQVGDDQTDALIDEALRDLVSALGIERSAVLRFSPGSDDLRIAHVWVEGPAPRAPSILRAGQFPWSGSNLRRGEAVAFSSLSALPPEAAVDLASFQAMGLRAHASVPVFLSGEVVGCLTCGSYSHERNWSDATLRRLRQMAAVIATVLARTIHAETLHRVAGFERLAATVLASLLIAGPGGEEAAIISGLHGIAGFLGVDRATLWRWDDGGGQYRVSHRWPSDAAGDAPDVIAEKEVPWIRGQLHAGRTVAFARPSDLPLEAASDLDALSRFGLMAVLAVPMAPSEGVLGAFVLSNTHREQGWPQNVIDGARLLAEVFASLLARRDAQAREQAAQRRAEQDRQALSHMARVDMLGKLSASIAHQLNQPLAAILANAEAARTMLGRHPVDMGELREICGDIVAEDVRAAEVIRRLGALYRRGEIAPVAMDLNTLVSETLELLRTELVKREVAVSADLDAGLPPIEADGVQLQQVVLNLMINAADAMRLLPPRERLRVSAPSVSPAR